LAGVAGMVPRREERGLPNALARAASAPAELGCGDGAVGLGKPGAAGRAGAPVSHAGLVCESVGRWGVGHADEGQGGAFEARRGGMAGVGPKRGSPAIAAGSAIGRSAGRCTNAAARLWSSTAAAAEGGTGARTSATKRCNQWVREGMVGWDVQAEINGRFRQQARRVTSGVSSSAVPRRGPAGCLS
jgi:hypothetical protein